MDGKAVSPRERAGEKREEKKDRTVLISFDLSRLGHGSFCFHPCLSSYLSHLVSIFFSAFPPPRVQPPPCKPQRMGGPISF